MNKWSLVLLVLCVSVVFSQEDSAESDAQYASMRRTACLVLSRYHSNTQKDTIESIVQSLSPEMQQNYINKIYASAVETCEPLINQSEVQEVHFFSIMQVIRLKPRLRPNPPFPPFRNCRLLRRCRHSWYSIEPQPIKHRQVHQAIRWRDGHQKRRKGCRKTTIRSINWR